MFMDLNLEAGLILFCSDSTHVNKRVGSSCNGSNTEEVILGTIPIQRDEEWRSRSRSRPNLKSIGGSRDREIILYKGDPSEMLIECDAERMGRAKVP